MARLDIVFGEWWFSYAGYNRVSFWAIHHAHGPNKNSITVDVSHIHDVLCNVYPRSNNMPGTKRRIHAAWCLFLPMTSQLSDYSPDTLYLPFKHFNFFPSLTPSCLQTVFTLLKWLKFSSIMRSKTELRSLLQGVSGSVSDRRAKKCPVDRVYPLHASLVPGGSGNIRSALHRLSEALRAHPHSQNIEEVIYFIAIGQSALPTVEQTVESANGSLQYLEYLTDGYAPAHEGAPTVTSYPRWDLVEAPRDAPLLPLGGGSASGAERGDAGGLCVEGLPVWALQFQIGSLAFRMGQSDRAMAAMESAFLSYETWLPRCWDYTFGLHLCFFCHHFSFPAQLEGGFALGGLLDKLCHCSQLTRAVPSAPPYMPSFISRIAFSIPPASRFATTFCLLALSHFRWLNKTKSVVKSVVRKYASRDSNPSATARVCFVHEARFGLYILPRFPCVHAHLE